MKSEGKAMKHYDPSIVFTTDNEFAMKKHTINKPTYAHTHGYIEMLYVIDGNGHHVIDDIEYPLLNGGFYMIDLEHSHALIFENVALYYDLYFSKKFLETLCPFIEDGESVYTHLLGDNYVPAVYFDEQQAQAVTNIITQMYNEYSSDKPHRKSFIGTHASLLFLELQRQVITQNKTATKHAPYVTLPRIIDYINQHFTEPLKLQDIASKYNYNSAYFGRLFKNTYKISFNDYLKKKRMEYAVDLLGSTTMSIDVIINKSGYGNRNHFYKCFHEKYHCTPNEYRADILAYRDGTFAKKQS